jgi:hypothetical protein
MIGDELFQEEMKIDALLSEIRSVYLQLEMKLGRTVQELCENDPSTDYIMPILIRQSLYANSNSEYGYGVLNGLPNDFSKMLIKDVPPESLVVLATDGYPNLMPTLELSEAELEKLRMTDPLCIHQFKSTRGWTNGKKALDDRAYIRFRT